MRISSTLLRRVSLGVCFALVGAGLYAYRLRGNLPEPIAKSLGLEHITVLPARIEPVRQTTLVAEAGGRIREVLAAVGELVEAGAVLAILENPEIAGRVETAEKRMEVAVARRAASLARIQRGSEHSAHQERMDAAERTRKAALDRLGSHSLRDPEAAFGDARRNAAAIRALRNQGMATKIELDSAEARELAAARDLSAAREHHSRLRQEAEQAESQIKLLRLQAADAPAADASVLEIEEARLGLASAREQRDRLTMRAPAAGVVLDLSVRPGVWIPAGAAIARIADLSSLLIAAPVSAELAARIAPGAPVTVRLPGGELRRMPGSVASVTLAPDAAQGAYLVRVMIPNPAPGTVLAGLEAALEFDHQRRP